MPLPLIAQALFAKGLDLLGNAVLAKGQEVIEEKLGVKLKPDMTDEEVAALRAKEIDHEEFLIEASIRKEQLSLEADKLDNENTDSARKMNSDIQTSANATELAKDAAYILDFVIVGFTVLSVLFLFFKGVPIENKEYFYMALGALLAHTGTIINFHRGTSARSKGKDETIQKLLGEKQK